MLIACRKDLCGVKYHSSVENFGAFRQSVRRYLWHHPTSNHILTLFCLVLLLFMFCLYFARSVMWLCKIIMTSPVMGFTYDFYTNRWRMCSISYYFQIFIQFQNGSKIPDKTLVGCVKKKSTLYEIFRFFRFLIKKLLL
jgi:hypothetical protein